MANKKMTALCMAAMLAASLGSVASASESGITFPLEESYSQRRHQRKAHESQRKAIGVKNSCQRLFIDHKDKKAHQQGHCQPDAGVQK